MKGLAGTSKLLPVRIFSSGDPRYAINEQKRNSIGDDEEDLPLQTPGDNYVKDSREIEENKAGSSRHVVAQFKHI